MKKFVSILLVFALVFSFSAVTASSVTAQEANTNEAAASENEAVLKFGEDGKFKIMQITDIQDNAFLEYATFTFLKDVVEAEKPDLIVLTGDNISGGGSPVKILADLAIARFMSIFDEAGIPVAMVFGNHDSEGPADKEYQMKVYESYDCFVGCEGEDLTGCGNYYLPIYDAEGEEMLYNLWMFDSLTYNRHPEDENDVAYYENDLEGYACVHKDQIDWYVRESNKLKEANGGEVVPSMVFQHIVVPEIYDALIKDASGNWALPEGAEGVLGEDPCPPAYSNGQFDAMVNQGDVVAMFFGHDHKNDFIVNHKGIDLSTTPGVGFSSYGNIDRGVRVIELDENDLSTYDTEVIRWVDFYDTENNEDAKNNFIIHANEYPFGEKLEAFIRLTLSLTMPLVSKVIDLLAGI